MTQDEIAALVKRLNKFSIGEENRIIREEAADALTSLSAERDEALAVIAKNTDGLWWKRYCAETFALKQRAEKAEAALEKERKKYRVTTEHLYEDMCKIENLTLFWRAALETSIKMRNTP